MNGIKHHLGSQVIFSKMLYAQKGSIWITRNTFSRQRMHSLHTDNIHVWWSSWPWFVTSAHHACGLTAGETLRKIRYKVYHNQTCYKVISRLYEYVKCHLHFPLREVNYSFEVIIQRPRSSEIYTKHQKVAIFTNKSYWQLMSFTTPWILFIIEK